jgi:hypothetical protein
MGFCRLPAKLARVTACAKGYSFLMISISSITDTLTFSTPLKATSSTYLVTLIGDMRSGSGEPISVCVKFKISDRKGNNSVQIVSWVSRLSFNQ